MSTFFPPSELVRAQRLELQELLGTWRARYSTAQTLARVYNATRWSSEREQADYLQYITKLCEGILGFNTHIVEALDAETEHRQAGEKFDFTALVEEIKGENYLWDNAWSVMMASRQFDNEFTPQGVKLVQLLKEENRSEFPNSLAVAQGRGMRRRTIKAPRNKSAARTKKAPAKMPSLS